MICYRRAFYSVWVLHFPFTYVTIPFLQPFSSVKISQIQCKIFVYLNTDPKLCTLFIKNTFFFSRGREKDFSDFVPLFVSHLYLFKSFWFTLSFIFTLKYTKSACWCQIRSLFLKRDNVSQTKNLLHYLLTKVVFHW